MAEIQIDDRVIIRKVTGRRVDDIALYRGRHGRVISQDSQMPFFEIELDDGSKVRVGEGDLIREEDLFSLGDGPFI